MLQCLKQIFFIILLITCLADNTLAQSRHILHVKRNETMITTFNVTLAETAQSRQYGLMFRNSLPSNQGMLFVYNHEEEVGMWMKNTFIPLDMVFISKDGFITEIIERPDTLTTRTSIGKKPAKYVLEINLGESSKRGIQVGDRIFLSRK